MLDEITEMMLNVLRYHKESLNQFYRMYHDLDVSTFYENRQGGVNYRILDEVFKIHHEDKVLSTFHKDPSGKGSIVSTIIKEKISISTKIKYYEDQGGKFFTVSRHENSKITGTVGTIVGGSPTFYCADEKRMFWVDMLDKDEHFNLSMNTPLISYNTYLVMRELYPNVPDGTVIKIKELFNE